MDGWIGPKPSQPKSKRHRKRKTSKRRSSAQDVTNFNQNFFQNENSLRFEISGLLDSFEKNSKQRPKFQTGDLVTAPYDGEMFDCKILKIVGDEAKVEWIGYEDDGPSWVQTTKMKLKQARKAKEKVTSHPELPVFVSYKALSGHVGIF